MRKVLAMILCLMLTGALAAPADEGRDILMVQRTTNNWTQEDLVTVLTADGSRLVFDLEKVPHEIRGNDAELLYFLRMHALSDSTVLYEAAPPVALEPLTAEQVEAIRALFGDIIIVPFEVTQDKLDAGDFLTYAVLPVDGTETLVLLSQAGNLQGVTTDPGSLALLALAEPYLKNE